MISNEPSPPHSISREKVLLAILIGQFFKNLSGQIGDLNLARFIPGEFGGNAGTYGFIIALYSITQFLLMIPFSRLSDHIGRKKVLLIGFSLFTIGSFLCAQAQTLWDLVFYRAIQGTGAYAGALMALISDYYDETSRSKPLAMQQTSVGLGALLGAALGGILISTLDARTTFLVVGGLSLIATIVYTCGIHDRFNFTVRKKEALENIDLVQSRKEIHQQTIRLLKTNRLFVIGVIFFMIRWFCFQGLVTYCNYSLLNTYHLSGFLTGVILVPIGLLYVIGLLLSGRRKNPPKLLKQGFLGLSIITYLN